MIYKTAVRIEGLTEETARALIQCGEVYRSWSLEAVLTSGKDQPDAHGATSLHKDGRAFDLRLPSRLVYAKFFNGEAWGKRIYAVDRAIAKEMESTIGDDFDVVLEHHQANPYAWHIHVEFDPKN